MKAVRIHSYGGLDELKVEDTPPPKMGDNEVLVQIHDAGVNPIDWKIRSGALQDNRPLTFPITMGQDCAGLVFNAGSKVSKFKKGDRVFGFARGSYAEYAAVPEEHLALMTPSMDFRLAASLPTAGLTAWQTITEALDLKSGQHLLIHGAGGGVGSLAVSIAKDRGARVSVTASNEDFSYLQGLGVDFFIDYKHQRFDSEVREMDAVLDLVGGEVALRSLPIIKKGGIIVSTTGAVPQAEAARFGVRSISFLMRPDSYGLERLADLCERGILQPRLNKILPLFDARHAQEINERGWARGKIVLEVMK